MHIAVDMASAEAITRAFAAAPAVVMDELQAAMGTVTEYLVRETRDRTPKNSALLQDSFIGRVTADGSVVMGTVSSSLPYALPVELGTKPHRPPVEPIISWVEQKLGLSGKEAESRAWAIAGNIAINGTPGFGMARYALADGRESIQAEFASAAKRISARIGDLA